MIKDWPVGQNPVANTSIAFTLNEARLAFDFVQQARVVISERLHGGLAALLCGIPHVLLDNRYGKNFGVYNEWVRNEDVTKLASNGEEALEMALQLLKMAQM